MKSDPSGNPGDQIGCGEIAKVGVPEPRRSGSSMSPETLNRLSSARRFKLGDLEVY
jgi:hypothetical protein